MLQNNYFLKIWFKRFLSDISVDKREKQTCCCKTKNKVKKCLKWYFNCWSVSRAGIRAKLKWDMRYSFSVRRSRIEMYNWNKIYFSAVNIVSVFLFVFITKHTSASQLYDDSICFYISMTVRLLQMGPNSRTVAQLTSPVEVSVVSVFE